MILTKPRKKIICSQIFFLMIILTSILILIDNNIKNNNAENDRINLTNISLPDFTPQTELTILSDDISVTPVASVIPPAQISRSRADEQFWATFQFDYSNTGYSTSKAPSTDHLLWKYKDDELNAEIYSSPVVVNDYVYFINKQGYLYAIDRTTGDQVWRVFLEKSSYGMLTVTNGYVYVGTGTEADSSDNKLCRFNALTGEEDEDFRISVSTGSIVGAPLVMDRAGVSNDRVYFGTLQDNKVYCYDFATNPPTQEWVYSVENPGSGSSDGIWSSLTFYDIPDPLILFSTNYEFSGGGISRGLYCIDTQGKLRWKFPASVPTTNLQCYSSPTLYYDQVTKRGMAFIGMGKSGVPSEGKLYCLDITNGNIFWEIPTGGGNLGYGVVSSPVVAYDRVFFGACDGKLYAANLEGNIIWSYQTPNYGDGIYSSPAVADNKVYFGSDNRYFYCLNVNNGSVIWKYNTSVDSITGTYGVVSSPSIAYNRVFFCGCNGYLYCFGSTGTEPPTISITNPLDNSVVKGVVEIKGVADDDVEVISVQVKIDNGMWVNTTENYTWTYFWDSSNVSDGRHIIYARAFDKTGFAITNISVIVNNAGGVMYLKVTSHEDGQIVSGITKFEGIAYHGSGNIIEVQLNISNSSSWEKAIGTTNWYYLWNTTNFEDGEYFIQFRAYDGFINSTPINLTVNVSNYVEPVTPGIYSMFRANQNRIGVSGYQVPSSVNILWKFQTDNQIESSAILYNNKIYFGSDDFNIYCLDSLTGNEQWRFSTDNQVRSTPIIANKKLFIGSMDFYFYCLDALDGKLLWKNRTGGPIDSSPLIEGDKVIFGSYDGYLYALNISDGQVIWKFNAGYEIWGSPAYSDECIYIGSISSTKFFGKMYCIWLNNGTERWNKSTNQFELSNGIYSTPVVFEGKVIFGSEDSLVYCLNSSTGDLIWKFKTTGYIYSSAAVNNDKVFISSLEEQDDGVLYALPLNDPYPDKVITSSEVLWKFKTHDYDGGSSPMVSTTSGKVVIGSNAGSAGGEGMVFCLDERTGEEIWNITLDGDVHGSPLIALNRIYIGSLDGYMYCLGGDINPQDLIQIKINISIPVTSILAGHAIENITFTALTEDDKPIPQAWFTFGVTNGFLSDYYGTAFEDGSYVLSYIAPEPNRVKNNITVILSVNASRFGYKNGSDSIEIIIIPRITKDDSGGSDGRADDEDIFEIISKPRVLNYLIIFIILLILIVIIYILMFRAKRKLSSLTELNNDIKDPVQGARVQPPKDSSTKQSPIAPPSTSLPVQKLSSLSISSPSKNIYKAQPKKARVDPQINDPTSFKPS